MQRTIKLGCRGRGQATCEIPEMSMQQFSESFHVRWWRRMAQATRQMAVRKAVRHLPEPLHERLMCQEVDVLQMVVRFILAMDFLFGLPRIDAFQDAEAPAAGRALSRVWNYAQLSEAVHDDTS